MIERPDRFTFNSKGLQDHLVIQQFYGTDSEHEENVRPRVVYHVLHAVPNRQIGRKYGRQSLSRPTLLQYV